VESTCARTTAVIVLTGGDREGGGGGGRGAAGRRDSRPPAARCCTVFGLDGRRPRRPFSVSLLTTASTNIATNGIFIHHIDFFIFW